MAKMYTSMTPRLGNWIKQYSGSRPSVGSLPTQFSTLGEEQQRLLLEYWPVEGLGLRNDYCSIVNCFASISHPTELFLAAGWLFIGDAPDYSAVLMRAKGDPVVGYLSFDRVLEAYWDGEDPPPEEPPTLDPAGILATFSIYELLRRERFLDLLPAQDYPDEVDNIIPDGAWGVDSIDDTFFRLVNES